MTAHGDRLTAERDAIGEAAFTAPGYRTGVIVHIVLLRFAPGVPAGERLDARRRFLALGDACRRGGSRYILDIVAGEPNGGEGAERGFEQGFVLRFGSEGDRNYYVGTPVVSDPACCDPAHDAFKRSIGPLLADGPDGVLVFDFAAERS